MKECPMKAACDRAVKQCVVYCKWYDNEERKCAILVIADKLKKLEQKGERQ